MALKSKLMNKTTTLFLVYTAMLLAINIVVTVFISLPAPFMGGLGNLNIGDSVVLVAAVVLGPIGGAVVGGLGGLIADLIGGYFMFAPFTLIIKAIEGLVCGLLFNYVLKRFSPFVNKVLTFIVCSAIVISGYFLAEIFIQCVILSQVFTVGLIAGAGTLVINSVQMVLCSGIAVLVSAKTSYIFKKE